MPDDKNERPDTDSRQPKTLVQFFRQSPLVGVETDLERDKDTGSDLEI